MFLSASDAPCLPRPVNEQLTHQDLSLLQSCYNPIEVIAILL